MTTRFCMDCCRWEQDCICGGHKVNVTTLPGSDIKLKDPRKLAQDHWCYIGKLLEAAGVEVTPLHEHLYIEAMVHGYKHADEDHIAGGLK